MTVVLLPLYDLCACVLLTAIFEPAVSSSCLLVSLLPFRKLHYGASTNFSSWRKKNVVECTIQKVSIQNMQLLLCPFGYKKTSNMTFVFCFTVVRNLRTNGCSRTFCSYVRREFMSTCRSGNGTIWICAVVLKACCALSCSPLKLLFLHYNARFLVFRFQFQ
jgi:hypothetical protein